MKTVAQLINQASRALKSNSPVILTGIGVSGVITTAYLAHQAAVKVSHDEDRPPNMDKIEYVKAYWPIYIPTFVSGIVTIGCVVGSNKVNARRAAAITAAYSISEKAFSEYKEKVIEKIGETKEQVIRDEIVQEKVANNPPQQILISSGGTVLCCELYTGRYFDSDMETLQKAKNVINDKLNREMYASLSDFYYLLGLPQTTYSSDVGWRAGKLMDLTFSTVMSVDDRPCLAFDYSYISPID